jgi:competence protein ComEA
MRDFLRQFLLYSRSERRAVIALVVLIVIVLLIPKVHRFYIAKPQILPDTLYKEFTKIERPIDTSEIETDSASRREQDRGSSGKVLFFFDPNTANIDTWLRLGLSKKQAESIEKYKATGARFHKPDDLRRIYVLSDEMKDRLVPYVSIGSATTASMPSYPHKNSANSSYAIEVNTADSAAFETLYGIGPYRASKIIHYRTLLGGFYSIDQVSETPKLPDSVYRQIKPHLKVDPSRVIKININTADYETLKKHPYIHGKIANAIINYRKV